MVTPAAKREAVVHLQELLKVSDRRACSIVGADRKSVRYSSRRGDDTDLRERLRDLARSDGGLATGGCITCCGAIAPVH